MTAGLLGVGLLAVAVGAERSAAASPSTACDQPAPWADERVCAAPALAGLADAVAVRFAALRDEVRADALRTGLDADQRDWLESPAACRGPEPAAEADCLEATYQGRLTQLVYYRFVYLGPALPDAPLLGCSLAATSQVEMRACMGEQWDYTERTLRLAAAAAAAELAELDRVTTAEIGARQAFERAQQAFEAYAQASCAALAASFAGGSITGLAELGCRLDASWRRANEIAAQYLGRKPHWSEALDELAEAMAACLEAAGGTDPRITGVREAEGGGHAMRIALDDAARVECVVSAELEVAPLVEVDGADVWPGEGLAIFYPKGSRLGAEKLETPPSDDCSPYRWVSTRAGDLAGWLQLANCW